MTSMRRKVGKTKVVSTNFGLNREKRWNKYNEIRPTWNVNGRNTKLTSDLAVKRKRGKKIDINMQEIVRENL